MARATTRSAIQKTFAELEAEGWMCKGPVQWNGEVLEQLYYAHATGETKWIPVPDKTEVDAALTPVLSGLMPSSAVLGTPSFRLIVAGTNFGKQSVIVFAGHDEPTTLEADGTVSTGIDMSVWKGPDVLKVSVKNGARESNELDFTFIAETMAPESARSKK